MRLWTFLSLFAVLWEMQCFQLMPNVIPESDLDELYGTENFRFKAYKVLLALMNLKVILEAYPSPLRQADQCRAIGCSTLLLSKWSSELPLLTIFSVHSEPTAAQATKMSMGAFANTHVYHHDPSKFAAAFPVRIDVLIINPLEDGRMGSFLMLDAILGAYHQLHSQSVILLSDCFGKRCDAAKIFLEHKGWKYEEEGRLNVLSLGSEIAESKALHIPPNLQVMGERERYDRKRYDWFLMALQKRLLRLDRGIAKLGNYVKGEAHQKMMELDRQLEARSNLAELGWKMIVEDLGIDYPKPRKFGPDEAHL
jgi:hypothetical protein